MYVQLPRCLLCFVLVNVVCFEVTLVGERWVSVGSSLFVRLMVRVVSEHGSHVCLLEALSFPSGGVASGVVLFCAIRLGCYRVMMCGGVVWYVVVASCVFSCGHVTSCSR